MRCPKCGFISFDHVEVCLKCNKDISKTSAKVVGTTYNAAPPSFLRFNKSTDSGASVGRKQRSSGRLDREFDVVDPDLDVLVAEDEIDDQDTEIEFHGDFGQGADTPGEDNFEFALEGDDENDEMGIDLGQFEDAFDEQQPNSLDDEVQLDLPDELADISDLDPPPGETLGQAIDQDSPGSPAGDIMDDAFDDFNFNLELDDIDDDFSLTSPEEKKAKASNDMDLGDLSLDDIGLSDLDKESKPKKKKSSTDTADMDADLDFDLDLGGLSLDD